MKVIFLDIDGVLNTSKTFFDIYNEIRKMGKSRIEIDLERVEYLKEIVDATLAVIVLSSSWRLLCTFKDGIVQTRDPKMAELITIFYEHNLSIYDITPRDVEGNRQKEICAWLNGKDIDSFVIFDDESVDLATFIPNQLIKTRFRENGIDECGLCKTHINLAIDILNHEPVSLRKRISLD